MKFFYRLCCLEPHNIFSRRDEFFTWNSVKMLRNYASWMMNCTRHHQFCDDNIRIVRKTAVLWKQNLLPSYQTNATRPYSEPYKSHVYAFHFWRSILILSCHPNLMTYLVWFFNLNVRAFLFLSQTFFVLWPSYPHWFDHTLEMPGYKRWSCCFPNFLHTPVSSSAMGRTSTDNQSNLFPIFLNPSSVC
jgi:hypothetical protein